MINEKISVIVPAYNTAEYLERCINSILSQTYPVYEIIIINDGSTDSTAQIIDTYAEKHNNIVPIHQANSGVSAARANGIARATGDWIGFVDSDDYIEPDMYEHLINNALKHSADISHCGYKMIFHNREDLYYDTKKTMIQDNAKGLFDLIAGDNIEPGIWNKLFNAKLFKDFDTITHNTIGVKINEDLLLNYYLFKQSKKSVFEDFCPYHYIVRSDSAANISPKPYHFTDPIVVRDKILKDTKNDPNLYNIAFMQYVRVLINAATQKHYKDIASEAKIKLKTNIKTDAFKSLRKKEKIMALLVAHFCPIYLLIRKIYNKITKVDHKYDLE